MQRLRGRAACLLLAACTLAQSTFAGTVAELGGVVNTLNADTTWVRDTYFILGDTQQFTTDVQRADDYAKIMTWVCNNRTAYNIVGVITVGDNVDDGSNTTQWGRLDTPFDTLDACGMPYVPSYGNHDGNPVVTNCSTPQDSSNYQVNLGRDRAYPKWWIKEVGHYTPSSLYLTDFTPRTYMADVGGPLLIISAEYCIYSDALLGETTTRSATSWIQRKMSENQDRMILVSQHDGSCLDSNCTMPSVNYYGTTYLARFFNNFVGQVNGHYNSSNCAGGWGYIATQTITGRPAAASSFLSGAFDHSCATRAYDTTGYSWNGLVRWNRKTRELCMQTIRVINASVIPATVLGTPDFNRTDASNDPETCVVVNPL